jgi:hypothetical protein
VPVLTDQTLRTKPLLASISRLRPWLSCLTLAALATSVHGQATTYSPIVGFVKITLNGTSTGSGDNYVGPALLEEELYRGPIAAGVPTANQLQAPGATWTTNQFDTHATLNSHFVEIVASSNPNAIGLFTDIVSHTADTLTTADDFSSQLTGGETIVIRAHKTVAGIFGAANESGIGGGGASTADTVSVMTAGTTPVFTSFYYRSGQALGGTGWRATSNPNSDQSARPLRTGDGILINRKQAGPMEVTVSGYIHEGPLRIPLKRGYNLIDPVAPITDQTAASPNAGPSFVLGGASSTLVIPSTLENSLVSGSAATADTISIRSGLSFISYYRRAGQALGGTGWRSTSSPSANMESTRLPAVTSYLFQIRNTGTSWLRPQTFNLP